MINDFILTHTKAFRLDSFIWTADGYYFNSTAIGLVPTLPPGRVAVPVPIYIGSFTARLF